MKLARRGMLRALVAAPFGAHAAAEQVKTSLLANAGAAGLAVASNVPTGASVGSSEAQKFWDFKEWLAKIGDRDIRRAAHNVTGFDPDLIGMRLPLATKVRIQRERNYARQLEDRRDWFQRRLSADGVIKDWL